MTKGIITFIILLSGIAIQAQTFNEATNEILGKINYLSGKKDMERIKTDYGSFGITIYHTTFANDLQVVDRIKLKLTNDHVMYDSILDDNYFDETRVGRVWTDLWVYYKPVKTKKFDNLNDAYIYKSELDKSNFVVYKEAAIYKHPKKEKYIVARIVENPNIYVGADDRTNILMINKWVNITSSDTISK